MLQGSYQYVLRGGEWVASNPRSTSWRTVTYVSTSVATAITLSTLPAMTNGTEVRGITATLKTSAGAAINGALITFKIGTATATAVTNASGVATCPSITPNASGSQTVIASFAKNGDYLSSSRSATVTVARKKTTLTYTGATWVQCWSGQGSHRSGSLWVGQYSSSNGMNRSWIGWTVAAIPSTAVNIVAKVTLTNTHWFAESGGTLTYGLHTNSAEPGTTPTLPAVAGSVSGWAKYATKQFTVSGWKNTTKGIAIFAKSTGQSEYGHFSETLADCKLTITYEE